MSLRVTRSDGAWGPRLLPAIVAGVVAAGVLVCVHAVAVGSSEGWEPNAPWLAGVLFASMVIAEVRPLQTIRAGDDSIITVSLAYSCALAFVLPGFGATLAVAAGTLFADVVNRTAPQKAAFNTAMMALSLHLGTSVLRAGGAQDLTAADPRDPMLLVTLLTAFVVIYSAATILVALVLSAVEEDSPIAVLRRDFFSTLPSDGMLLPLGPVLVVVGTHDPVLLPLAMVLTAVVHTSTRISTERERDATEDSLTGLLNRRALEQEAEAGLDRAARSGRRVVVLLMDLNRFKVINDTWGHHAGDEVIVEIARRLRDRMPTAALVARLGGRACHEPVGCGSALVVRAPRPQPLRRPRPLLARVRTRLAGGRQITSLGQKLDLAPQLARIPLDGLSPPSLAHARRGRRAHGRRVAQQL